MDRKCARFMAALTTYSFEVANDSIHPVNRSVRQGVAFEFEDDGSIDTQSDPQSRRERARAARDARCNRVRLRVTRADLPPQNKCARPVAKETAKLAIHSTWR